MFQFRKEFLIVYLLIVIVGGLALFRFFGPKTDIRAWMIPFQRVAPSADVSPTQAQQKITVTVDFGDGRKKTSSDISASNALAALQQIAVKENLDLQLKTFDFGTLVQKIETYENTQEKAWIYYVNGQSGDVAAEQKELKAGDTVEWRYVTPQ